MSDPRAEFERLRPAREQVIRLMRLYHPATDDYVALLAISEAILGAARRFIPDDPYFLSLGPPSQ